MDIKELEQRWRSLANEMEALTTPPDDFDESEPFVMDEKAAARFDELEGEVASIEGQIATIRRRESAISRSQLHESGDDRQTSTRFGVPGVNYNRDPYDVTTIGIDATVDEMRGRIETGLERDRVTPDSCKDEAMRTLDRVHGNKSSVARLYLATGSTKYRSAFAKAIAGQEAQWTDDERLVMARAQSLTDAAGGYAVPFTLDPTIIGTDAGSINPMRRISRVVQTTTDSWNGVTGPAVSFTWRAEGVEETDAAITLAQPSIPVHKLAGFVPFSIEVGSDWAAIDSDLRNAMIEGRDNAEATAHINGTGSGQPTGIITALDGGASEVAQATGETFTAEDVYNLQRQLPPRHRMTTPRWVMNIGTANDIRQFDTGGGGNFWTSLAPGAPETLLGWPWEESSVMDDSPDINPAVTADNFILLVGNFSRYIIVDRVGMTVELIPHLFGGTANYPTGQRGLYAYLRSGADSVDDNAFRLLNVATTL